jgi:hypothetical protein
LLAVTDETFYMVRATQAKVTALTLAPALFASAAVGIQNPNACSIQHSIPLVYSSFIDQPDDIYRQRSWKFVTITDTSTKYGILKFDIRVR